MTKKNVTIVIFLFVLLSIIYKIIIIQIANKALKDSAVVTAVVQDISGGRGAFYVDVKYEYNGKSMESEFATYHLDSIHKYVKVRLLISIKHPDKYVQYLGIAPDQAIPLKQF